jgi:SnoaL-like domain
MAASLASDKSAVAEACYRYATGIDRRDWALYRSIFADDVAFDFSSYNGRAAQGIPADVWVAGVKPLFTGLAATQHSMTNPLAVIDGNVAAITMYMQAHHVLDPADPLSFFTIGGYYENTLLRNGDGWLLASVKLVVTWRAGDEAIMELARSAGERALADD